MSARTFNVLTGCLIPDAHMATNNEEIKTSQEDDVEEGTEEVVEDLQDSEEDTENSSKIDFEAELAKERERSAEKDQIIAEKDFKLREKKRKEKAEDDGDDTDDDSNEDDDDKPLTKRQLAQVLAENNQKVLKESRKSEIAIVARKLADSDSEAALIVEIHKNRTFPSTLSLDEQLAEAHAIANAPRLRSQNAELKRSLLAKKTTSTDASSSQRMPISSSEPKISPQDAQVLKGAGFEWDGKQRLYKKKLSNGSFLYRDPKTKKTFKR
jgi:hypothetical protein